MRFNNSLMVHVKPQMLHNCCRSHQPQPSEKRHEKTQSGFLLTPSPNTTQSLAGTERLRELRTLRSRSPADPSLGGLDTCRWSSSVAPSPSRHNTYDTSDKRLLSAKWIQLCQSICSQTQLHDMFAGGLFAFFTPHISFLYTIDLFL